MFSLTVLHIAQLKLIHNIFGDPITGYKPNLLDLYSVSDLSENSQLWKKRETNFVELKCFRPCMYSIFDTGHRSFLEVFHVCFNILMIWHSYSNNIITLQWPWYNLVLVKLIGFNKYFFREISSIVIILKAKLWDDLTNSFQTVPVTHCFMTP